MVPFPSSGKSDRSSIWNAWIVSIPGSMGCPDRKKPSSSFSFLSSSSIGISGISGYWIATLAWSSSDIMSKSESWPRERSFRSEEPVAMATGAAARSWLRRFPKQSNAPDRISALRSLWLTPSTRQQNSSRSRKGPPSLRASMICWTIPSPTVLIAANPNRMSFPLTEKCIPLVFTSGESTRIPISRHSFR